MIKYLLFLVFALIALLIYLNDKYYNIKELKKHTAWIMSKEQRYISLSAYIHDIQSELNIPEKYRISSEEKETTEEILKSFQNHFSEWYFNDRIELLKFGPTFHEALKSLCMHESLKTILFTTTDLNLAFFICYLRGFLEDHKTDYYFLDHNMHEKTIYYNCYSYSYISSEGRYELSNFAITYYKLYYISFLYCQTTDVLRRYRYPFLKNEDITDILDTKQITIKR